MDVKQYFQRVRELATQLPADAVVIKSVSTTNGGRAGVMTEVNRYTAAKQVVDGNAVLATEEESAAYHQEMEVRRQVSERAQALNRLQISLSTAAQMQSLSILTEDDRERE